MQWGTSRIENVGSFRSVVTTKRPPGHRARVVGLPSSSSASVTANLALTVAHGTDPVSQRHDHRALASDDIALRAFLARILGWEPDRTTV